jgi:GT2 family glycosyltransferase
MSVQDVAERVCSDPLVTVLILTHNARPYLDACLESVLDQDFPRDQYEVLVVDNASTDGSADYVAANYPQVGLVRHERNLGVDEGLNRVKPQGRGRYAAYLSQDVVVHRRWLSALVEAMGSDPKARLLTSNIYFSWWPEFEGTDRVGWPEQVYVCDLTGYGVLDYYMLPLTESSRPIPVLAADTAASMIDARLLQELGYLLDEDFFMYGDVIDLCLRINSMGLKVLFVPGSIAYNDSDWELKLNRRTLLKALRSSRNNLLAFLKVSYAGEFVTMLPRLLLGHVHRGGQHGLSRWRNLLYSLAALPVALLGLALAVAHIPRMQPKRRLALEKRTTPRGWLVERLRRPGWQPDPRVWLPARAESVAPARGREEARSRGADTPERMEP